MSTTHYIMERPPGSRKKVHLTLAQTPAQHRERMYAKVAGLANGRILSFATARTADAYVAADPKNRSQITMRDLEKLLHSSHGSISRVVEDGEAQWAHIYDIAYVTDGDHAVAVGVSEDSKEIVRLQRYVYGVECHKLLLRSEKIVVTCGRDDCINPEHLALEITVPA